MINESITTVSAEMSQRLKELDDKQEDLLARTTTSPSS